MKGGVDSEVIVEKNTYYYCETLYRNLHSFFDVTFFLRKLIIFYYMNYYYIM